MKRRKAIKAVFIGVEDSEGGVGDLFIKYLKERFRTENVRVTHQPCHGGSYEDMTIRAKRVSTNIEFELRFLVWDADRIKHGNDQPKPHEGYTLLLCEPCIEGEILSLTGVKPSASKECKKQLGEIRHVERMRQLLSSVSDERFVENPIFKVLVDVIRTGTVSV